MQQNTGNVDEQRNEALNHVIGDLWASDRIVRDVTSFCDECGHRFAGTQSEILGRDFLVEKFKLYGLDNVRLESCRYTGWRRGPCELSMVAPFERDLTAVSMVLSPPIPGDGHEADVIYLGQGTKADFDRMGDAIRGKFVLVRTSSPLGTFVLWVTKYGWARERGALGVIFVREDANQLVGTGTIAAGYRESGEIPAVEVSYETGEFLLRSMDRAPVRLRLRLQSEIVPDAETWNIVGDLPGASDSEEQIIVGAHWDGLDRADGAMDNALGVFTMLDTARALGRLRGSLRRNIRFVGFGVEESWLVGSTNYVAQHHQEMDQVALMINCDAIARFGRTHIRLGRPELFSYFDDLVRRESIPTSISYSGWLPGSSDEWPFLSEGVPTIAMRGTQSWEERSKGRGLDHTQADTVDKIDDVRARQSAMMLAQVLVAAANSDARSGDKRSRNEMFQRFEEDGAYEELRVQGRWHPDSIL